MDLGGGTRRLTASRTTKGVLMTSDGDEILEKLLREQPICKLIKQAIEECEP